MLSSNATTSAIAGSGPMLIWAAAPEAPINKTLAATGMPMLIALEFAIFVPFFILKEMFYLRCNQIFR
jgi:uncharacterized membrane protein YraQ (UPF0718 family)